MFGLIFVILGILFLFEEMEIIQGDFWGYFWPIILIALGFNMMKKDRGGINCHSFFNYKNPKSQDKKHHKVVDEQ